jgi:hypothetical protein
MRKIICVLRLTALLLPALVMAQDAAVVINTGVSPRALAPGQEIKGDTVIPPKGSNQITYLGDITGLFNLPRTECLDIYAERSADGVTWQRFAAAKACGQEGKHPVKNGVEFPQSAAGFLTGMKDSDFLRGGLRSMATVPLDTSSAIQMKEIQ